MNQEAPTRSSDEVGLSGFAILDDRGRIVLSKATRQALKLHPGSAIAYAVVDGTIVLIPQDQQLAEVSARAVSILERAELTVDSLLAELPDVRADILREDYGDASVDAFMRRHAAVHGPSGDSRG